MNKSELMKQFEALESECKKIDSCFDCNNCSNCNNCNNCNNCYNCYNCNNCNNCEYCILCCGLRNKFKGYWLLNKEVSKEDFEAAKKELLS